MRRRALALMVLLCACQVETKVAPEQPPAQLPGIGVQLSTYPPGAEKEIADRSCLNCHSAEISLQQRITEKQWTAVIEKMIRWGAELQPEQKAALTAYLVRHFGPNNQSFQPIAAQPE